MVPTLAPTRAPTALPERDEAKFVRQLIRIEAEENSLSLDSSPGTSEDRAQSSDSRIEGPISSYESATEAEKVNIHVAKSDTQNVNCQPTLG